MKKIILLLSVLVWPISFPVVAQDSLFDLPPVNGAKIDNQVVSGTSSSFIIGLSRDQGISFENDIQTDDIVEMSGVYRAEPGQINQQADLFVVSRVDGITFWMRNLAGEFLSWNGSISQLVPAYESETLVGDLTVEVFSGSFSEAGTQSFFLGYMPDGEDALYFTPNAHNFFVSEAEPEISRQEQALALFQSTIFPNIIQPTCSVCHVEGGIAGTTSLVYSSSIQEDFTTLNSYVAGNLSTVNFILAKASFSLPHNGGAQLPLNSQNYNDMSEFLNLLVE